MLVNEIKNSAYALPWKNNNTSRGFVEVTKKCNIRCPMCYQQEHFLGSQDKPLELVKEEIDILIDALNPSMICIIGGEPLEYPFLLETIKYIADKKIEPLIMSNTINLTDELLEKLIKNGLKFIYAHIDDQTVYGQYKNSSYEKVLADREHFAITLRKQKNKIFGYLTSVICDEDLLQINNTLKWSIDNRDVIKYCMFIAGNNNHEVSVLADQIKNKYKNFKVNSYLSSINSNYISWGLSTFWVKKNGTIRYYPYKFLKYFNLASRIITNKWNSLLPSWFLKIFPGLFTVVILRPQANGRFCAGCPDQTIIWINDNGNRVPLIVHSCLTNDFMSPEGSTEEDYITNFALNNPEKKSVCICDYKNQHYTLDKKVIRNWDEILKFPRKT